MVFEPLIDLMGYLIGKIAFALNWLTITTPIIAFGGVGPMTIACLLRNTLIATCRQAGLAAPAV